MKPYYDRDGITIYHGDAREILPTLGPVDVIVTDPVWPNAVPSLAGSDDPSGLFASAAAGFPRLSNRLVVHLGCDSDPRFLLGVPDALPFFRVCWLEYVRPHYKGRLMYGSDVAYVFGEPPPSEAGAHVMPGRYIDTSAAGKEPGHPCPRHLAHVKWLLRWYARGPVLDPFMGIGTTALAAKEMHLPFIGIEVDEGFCETAANRLAQGVLL